MPLILGTNSIKDTGYDVANSLRFDDGSSDTLQRTFSAGNQKTWSFSTWLKRGTLGLTYAKIIGTDYVGLGEAYLTFNSNDQLYYGQYTGGGASGNYVLASTDRYRDTNAWYHVLFVWDTTQSTSSDRLKLFVNGSQVTSFSTATYPAQNYDGVWNRSGVHYISGGLYGNKYDGYQCETVFVDGTALSPTDVGEFDSDSPNIWIPKSVSGLTFGTNGFYLEFKQSGTSANSSGLGADTSGNDHHFTVNNLTAVDQSLDTCTNNFAVGNNLIPSLTTYSNGNLTVSNGASWKASGSTLTVTQGKWYAEMKVDVFGGVGMLFGVEDMDLVSTWSAVLVGTSANGRGYYYYGTSYNNGSATSFGSSYGAGDIIGAYLDMDNKFVYFSKNGVMQNSGDPSSGSSGTGGLSLAGTEYCFAYAVYSSTVSLNFGSPPFAISSGNQDANGYGNFEYNPTYSGVNYYSLNTKNLEEFG